MGHIDHAAIEYWKQEHDAAAEVMNKFYFHDDVVDGNSIVDLNNS